MNLSNVSNMRFNGAVVKLAKIDGIIIYRKDEEDVSLIARYTANTSGVVPTFNSGYVYEVNETENNGIYTVEITSDADFISCDFNGKSELLAVEHLKVTSKVTSMHTMFQNCSKLTSLDVSNFDTSNVTTMYGMFQNCSKLTSLDVSNFDTSKVTDMSYMFRNCSNLTSLDSMKNIATDLSLPASLNEESVLDVIDNLKTVTTTKTLVISATQLSWVSEDKIIEANNKGWTISV